MKSTTTLAVGACYAAMTTLAISLNLMPVCLPLIKQGFGGATLTDEQLGRLGAMAFVGLVTAILLTGPLANRYHAKIFAVAGNLCIAAGLAFAGFSRSYEQLLAAVGLMGFGGGILDMILSPIVCALQPEQRTRAMNWLHSFYCVGAAATILIATVALGWISWRRLSLALVVLPAAVTVVLCAIRLPDIAQEPAERTRVRELLRKRFFLLTLGAIFLGGAAEMGLVQWLPAFAELELHMPAWIGGGSLLAFSLAMALGRMGAGHLVARMTVYRMLTLGGVATTVLFLVVGFCPLPWVALPAAILAGLTGSWFWPSILAMAGDRYPLAGATMFGLLSAAGNFGGIVMPWAVGLIADRLSIGVGLAAAAICPVLMLVLLWRMNRQPALTPP
jgi:fucose permease